MTKPLSQPHHKAGKVARLRLRPESFGRLSGLSVETFDDLLHQLQPLFEEAEHKRLERANRRQAIGGGRNYDLPLEDRLLLLMSYRLYVSQETLGIWHWSHEGLPDSGTTLSQCLVTAHLDLQECGGVGQSAVCLKPLSNPSAHRLSFYLLHPIVQQL
jgi:hypothetical protein